MYLELALAGGELEDWPLLEALEQRSHRHHEVVERLGRSRVELGDLLF